MINTFDYNKAYVDLDFDFKKNELTKDIKLRTGTAAISQSIKNIVLTAIGERPFNDEIGIGLYNTLFDLDDPVSLTFLRSKIEAFLNSLETRIECSSNTISIVRGSGNDIQINISYKLKNYLDSTLLTQQQQLVTITISGDR